LYGVPVVTRPLTARAEATRARLLDAAQGVIAREGYEGATIDAIAEAAGVSKGAFYGHFPSKEAAFAAVLRERCAAKRAQLRAVCEAELDRGRSAMVAGFTQGFANVLEDREWIRLFIEHARFAEMNAEAREVHAAEYRAFAELIAELLERSRALGLLDFEGSAAPMARVMMAVVDGFALQFLVDPDAVVREEVAPMVAHVFGRALGGQ
jgi:AcrR family transcriptional regulator